jgi:hypothetical protein
MRYLLFFSLLVASAYGQADRSSISGALTDPGADRVPGALVQPRLTK